MALQSVCLALRVATLPQSGRHSQQGLCICWGDAGALPAPFFRCHSDSHPQKVAVFSPKLTFKDHIFIGEKAFLLLPALGKVSPHPHPLALISGGPASLPGLVWIPVLGPGWRKPQRLLAAPSDSVRAFLCRRVIPGRTAVRFLGPYPALPNPADASGLSARSPPIAVA